MSNPAPIHRVAALSKEYVKVPVAATVNGATYNPTVDAVTIAFKKPAETPAANEFLAASWETINGKYYARALIGPGGGVTTLTPGRWNVWVKVTDNPEIPVIDAGQIEIY